MKELLERLYSTYGTLEYVNPDPVLYVHAFDDPFDREVAGFVASQFALGRAASILGFLKGVFSCFSQPSRDMRTGEGIIRWKEKGPQYYRFYNAGEIEGFFYILKDVLCEYGSLQELFLKGYRADGNVWKGLESLAGPFKEGGVRIVADPAGGSACKRLHLFLRWMTRRDAVDTGIWNQVDPKDLKYPVDTHILRIAKSLGITSRRQADSAAVEDISAFFSRFSPEDPVRYDFCLARLGIHPDLDYSLAAQGMNVKKTDGCAHTRSA
ncbi:MAG: TIGR02757 family protein [Spirochaetales bacterium]|nr:TIGR02757 family protein [Spirochaetales bacterium]